MSVIDILTRVETLCQKYDKYDVDKQHDQQVSGNDAFVKLYTVFEKEIAACEQKSSEAAVEKNRAAVATLNAELRRTKGELRNEFPKLEKLAQRKVKGVSQDDLTARPDLVVGLVERLNAIPDGVTMGAEKPSFWGGKAAGSRMDIKIDDPNQDDLMRPGYFQQTQESSQFRQEFEMRRRKQDEGLETISEGLATLKSLAQDINEEMDRQDPLLDEIDEKADKLTADLKNTNVRLKDTVLKMRSSRNFCIDIILLCIILGIAAYLYNVLKK
ncbi:hypothetical protein KP509_30G067500 [Ceratopteris richardii]|uniref:t-SNARE coiled-coil homology domain-containing protein n=1 Tax=Ceratopteris richardii TaxID=49495 RepID=A0A8T2R4E2_CERRI|nr:hypothetical protein KP509_30G067500 [Ceratopteris richardii]